MRVSFLLYISEYKLRGSDGGEVSFCSDMIVRRWVFTVR